MVILCELSEERQSWCVVQHRRRHWPEYEKREMVMDIALTLNAVVNICTTCSINKKLEFCPKYVCCSYNCHIILRLLHGCNSHPEDGSRIFQGNAYHQPKTCMVAEFRRLSHKYGLFSFSAVNGQFL
jgi:hypothetical protein